MNDNSKGIILYGGSFNPLHIGHMRVAIETMAVFQNYASRLYFLPSYMPPHKNVTTLLPFQLREEMINSVLGDNLYCCSIESSMSAPSYTYNTMHELANLNRNYHYYFILGSQDFKLLPTWQHGLELPKLCALIVEPRGELSRDEFYSLCYSYWPTGQPKKTEREKFGDTDVICYSLPGFNHVYMEFIHFLDLSSTMIRDLWLNNKNIDYLVPEPVLKIINNNSREIRTIWQEKAAKC